MIGLEFHWPTFVGTLHMAIYSVLPKNMCMTRFVLSFHFFTKTNSFYFLSFATARAQLSELWYFLILSAQFILNAGTADGIALEY